MIKINVITNNIHWLNYIKQPNSYVDRKIEKLNAKNRKYKKKYFFCSLLLSGNKEIKKLNKKFRKKNKVTDVLAFPFQTKKDLNNKLKKNEEIYLGDIIINLNKIKNKKKLKAFKFEFDRLCIHGLVHLFGYDHKKNTDYIKMKKIEKEYFNLINV